MATIGPASRSPEKLRELVLAGMNVARLNFSHGKHETHLETLRNLRAISQELGQPIAILQDLQGVKIRTGALENGEPVELRKGRTLEITTEQVIGTRERVSTSYESLPADVREGDRILLSDGLIELRVLSTTEKSVLCEVITGGTLGQNQGINIPGATISAPALTAKDLVDLEFAKDHQVDFIALSFVRRPEDILELKRVLGDRQAEIPVIAKLEKPTAIENLDAILDVCEGVMVARGDLGVEMPPEQVPVIQKQIIRKANRKNRLVITATQMLESMIGNPRPTRAEVSDVANAVFDGTDALMLSAETATGQYPIESVRMMARIIEQAERMGSEHPPKRSEGDADLDFPEAVCDAAYHASKAIRARAIVAFTQSGSTAKLISKYRPQTEIFAFTPHPRITNRMCLYWGVKPMRMEAILNVDELIRELDRRLIESRLVKEADNLIILTGAPIIEKGHTNLMKLHSVTGTPRPAESV